MPRVLFSLLVSASLLTACGRSSDPGRCVDAVGDGCEEKQLPPPPPPAPVTLSGNGDRACQIDENGALWCWGQRPAVRNATGTPTRMDESTDWRSVAAADGVCGIKADGSLWCWDDRDQTGFEQLGDAAWTAVVGRSDSIFCGLQEGGTLWCWDLRYDNPPQRVGELLWRTIAAGSCGIQQDETLACWRAFIDCAPNRMGACALLVDPVERLAPGRFISVSGSRARGCAVMSDGTLWCWPGRESRQGLAQVGQARDLTFVTDTRSGSCALKLDGSLWCWGENLFGQTGSPAIGDVSVPTRIESPNRWLSVVHRGTSVCARAVDGQVFCWGQNNRGQLGQRMSGEAQSFEPIAPDATWAKVVPGREATVGLQTDGSLWCWGICGGRLTDLPASIDQEQRWLDVTTSKFGFEFCAIASDHSLWCWSSPADTDASAHAPSRVGSDNDWKSVSLGLSRKWPSAIGLSSMCGLRLDDSLWCWGSNSFGEAGVGHAEPVHEPAEVSAGAGWASVGVGTSHACGVRLDGTLWCWGANDRHQLGDGGTEGRLLPAQVGVASDWSRVVAELSDTCALRKDGSLWCWGANEGPLGFSSSASQAVPARVGEETWLTVDVHSYDMTCGITTDGALRCLDWKVHEVVGEDRDWSSVSGSWATCAIKTSGALWCRGDNEHAQVGNGRAFRSAPQPVDL